MPSKIDARRLRDGAAASSLLVDNLKELSLERLKTLKDTLFDGVLAMQSLDDLGSKEANKEAWDRMIELQERYNAVEAEYKKRKAEQ
jgi:Skp family chaperone for outer membrane proteins